MPERDKQTDAMARTLAGAPHRSWNTKLGTQPDDVTADAWDEAQSMADRLYVDMIESTDFQRVLLQAQGRHAALHPGKSTFLAMPGVDDFSIVDTLCHKCMTEVMLARDTNPPWTVQADSPRYVKYQEPDHGPLVIPPSDNFYDLTDP